MPNLSRQWTRGILVVDAWRQSAMYVNPLGWIGCTTRILPAMMSCAILLTGCVVTPAPGADKVKVTKEPAEVSACNAVGNVHVPRDPNGNLQFVNVDVEFRNLVVGLGGNVGFITAGSADAPTEGIAYHCP